MFGGVGHTWEHLASVRLRRALVSRALLGDEDVQWAALAGVAPSRTPAGLADGEGYDLRDDTTEAGFRADLRAWLASPDGQPGDGLAPAPGRRGLGRGVDADRRRRPGAARHV